MITLRRSAWLLVTASVISVVAPAAAQTTPGEAQGSSGATSGETNFREDESIIVTARKVSEPLEKAPVAVTAYTQEQLREREIRQPQDLNIATPSLTVAGGAGDGSGGRNEANFQVRGLSVGGATYFAGAPSAVGAQQFFDLGNIQIVNGPQGTLFGRTSTGGAVLIEPARPTFEFDGMVQAGVGNLDYRRLDGMINVPLIDDVLSVRLAGYILRRDGYTKALNTGQDLDDQHRESFRLGVTFKPFGDTLDTYTMLQYQNINENGVGNIVRDFDPSYTGAFGVPVYSPGIFSTPIFPGFTLGDAFFGSICGAEAARSGVPGNSAFISGCTTQRAGLFATAGAELAAAKARHDAGDVRSTNTSEANAYYDRRWTALNNSTLKLGGEGFLSDVAVKNIFSYSWTEPRPSTFNDLDGIASALLDLQAAQPNGEIVLGNCQTSGPNIGFCDRPVQSRASGFATRNVLSEEVNLSATVGDKLDLLAGYFYYRQRTNFSNQLFYSAFGNAFSLGLAPAEPVRISSNVNREEGMFVSGTLDLSDWAVDGLSVSAGYRRTNVFSQGNPETGVGTGVYTPVAYRESGNSRTFTIDWQATDSILIYARSGSGFQPGGTNAGACADVTTGQFCPATYAKQTATDYELGTKIRWGVGDVKLRTEAAVYRTDFTNIQRAQFIPTGSGTVTNPIFNTAKARIDGFEVTQGITYQGFKVSASYSLTNSRTLRDFQPLLPTYPCSDPFGNNAGDCLDLAGDPLYGAAKHKIGALVSWEIPLARDKGTITPSAQAGYTSRIHYGQERINPLSSAPGYWLFNARLDWNDVMGRPIDIALFGRNIFDKKYVTAVLPLGANSLFGFNTVQYGEPATYGLEVRVRFGAGAR